MKIKKKTLEKLLWAVLIILLAVYYGEFVPK